MTLYRRIRQHILTRRYAQQGIRTLEARNAYHAHMHQLAVTAINHPTRQRPKTRP